MTADPATIARIAAAIGAEAATTWDYSTRVSLQIAEAAVREGRLDDAMRLRAGDIVARIIRRETEAA